MITAELRERKVRLAVAASEFMLGRPITSVLDVGCGEGSWRAVLRRLRPGLEYIGVDPSEYVVRRFGRRRNIRPGSFEGIGQLGIKRKFDLIVCADVLMYVPDDALRRGLAALRKLARGLAYIESYTTGDDMVGDFDGWIHRSEAFYRKVFKQAGFVACGLHCWAPREQLSLLAEMERCG